MTLMDLHKRNYSRDCNLSGCALAKALGAVSGGFGLVGELWRMDVFEFVKRYPEHAPLVMRMMLEGPR